MKTPSTASFLNVALLLGLVTIGYNIIEGAVSIWFGLNDFLLLLAKKCLYLSKNESIIHECKRSQKS